MIRAAVWILTVMLLFVQPAAAKEYFVALDGDNSAAGDSADAAWRDLQFAVDRLEGGDILTLAPGEYAQSFIVRQKATAEAPITIRAAIDGFSVLRGNESIRGFRKVADTRFLWVADMPKPVYRVMELDTGEMYIEAPAVADMDQFRNAYFYDAQAGKLYIHTSDGRPATEHTIVGSTKYGYGIQLTGTHTRLEGIVIRGFVARTIKDAGRGFGVYMLGSGHEISRCTFLYNGGGLTTNGQHCTVSDSLFIGNVEPGYGELAQIYNTSHSDSNRYLNNIILDGQTHGLRFYNNSQNGVAIGNIIKNNRIGLYYKSSGGNRVAQRNVVVDSSFFNWNTGTGASPMDENFNTLQSPSSWHENNQAKAGPNTLLFGKNSPDPKFADPDHLDYRLQSDSPHRGGGPNGSDVGAYPYEANVFYVSPQGNDSRDGLSVVDAFATVGRAVREAKPGVTIYLLPGTYDEAVVVNNGGAVDRPLVIRGRGDDGPAHVKALQLRGAQHVVIENVRSREGASLEDCASIRIEQSVLADSMRVHRSRGVWFRRCTVWGARDAAIVVGADCADLRVTSCILQSQSGPAVSASQLRGSELFSEYNNYLPGPNQPAMILQDGKCADVEVIRNVGGNDRMSFSADPQWLDADDPRIVSAGSPCTGAGELAGHVGAVSFRAEPLPPLMTDTIVRQVTPTTFCMTWWTPHTSDATRRNPAPWYARTGIHAEVHYGENPTCKQVVYSFGDLYHRVTLRGLKPNTTYYYRIVIPEKIGLDDLWAPYQYGPDMPDGQALKGPLLSFKTPAAESWKPERRTFYVAPHGDPAADGLTESSPTTLTAVSDRVLAGDTVIALDGEYREMFAPAATGVVGAPITFAAQHPGAACMDGSAYTRPTGVAIMGKDQIIVDGLVFRRFAHQSHGCRAGLNYAQFFLARCGDVTIRNCVLFGWGNYGKALAVRGAEHVTIENSVLTGFESSIGARQIESLSLLNCTFYVPLIINFDSNGHVVVRNTLFFGQQKQKVFNYQPMVSPNRPTESDYNAYYFGPDNPVRYIGFGVKRDGDKVDVGGVARIQEVCNLDVHSFEPTTEQARMIGSAPTDYFDDQALNKFVAPMIRGEVIPTLEMFCPTADGPLQTGGSDGGPIGARPVTK